MCVCVRETVLRDIDVPLMKGIRRETTTLLGLMAVL